MPMPAGRHLQRAFIPVRMAYKNAIAMLSAWRSVLTDFILPPGQITRPLCAPRQASPSDNVLPVSVIPLRPPFARVEKSRQTGYGLFPGFQITVAVAAIRAIYIAGPLRIRCGHRHSAGLAKTFVLCHRSLLLSFGCLLNIQNLRMALSVSDQ